MSAELLLECNNSAVLRSWGRELLLKCNNF